MSEIKALEKLRKLTICDKGEEYTAYLDAGDIADEIEAEIAERFMGLPVDRSDNPWHIGDKFPLGDMDGGGHVCTVSGVSADEVFFYYDEHSSSSKHRHFKADKLVHYRPRTLEDVLREMLDRNGDGIGMREFNRDFDAFVEHYADEIRAMFGEVDS